MFIPSPLQLKAMIVGALAAAVAILSLLVWGLYWRGEYREAKVALAAAIAQGAVLADKLDTCSAATSEAKRVGDAAIAAMGGLVAAARKAHQERAGVATTLEEIARLARKPGEGCDWAWEQVEAQKRKAGAAP